MADMPQMNGLEFAPRREVGHVGEGPPFVGNLERDPRRRRHEPHDAASSPAVFGKSRFLNSSTSASDFAISVLLGLTMAL